MNISCPKCNHLYKNIPGKNIGKKSKCINCSKIFIIRKEKTESNNPILKPFNKIISIFGIKKILIIILILIGLFYFITKNNITEVTYIPNKDAKYAIVTMHGYGSNGENFISISKDLMSFFGKELANEFSFFSPNAPYKISSRPGYSWANGKVDISSSAKKTANYINNIHNKYGIEYENIFLFGFSEGGAMALHISNRLGGTLGGIIVAGSGLFQNDHNMDFSLYQSLYITAGNNDTFAPASKLNKAQSYLESFGWEVQKKVVGGIGHSISDEQIGNIADFIKEKISNYE